MAELRKNPFNNIYTQLNDNDRDFNFPVCIDMELTNNCNLHCLFCPTGTDVSVRNKGFMTDEVFQKIISDIKGKKIGLRFSRWGEPTLHPRIINFLTMAKKDGHLLHLNTNGQLLNETFIEDLIKSGLDSIKFSFQGVDQKSYQEMRQDSSFIKLVENIKIMHKIRGEQMLPYIHISTTTTYETDDEIKEFKEGINPYCDLVTVGKTKLEHIEIEKTKLNKTQKELLSELKKKESMAEERLKKCPEVFGKVSIDWDGQITACCSDYNREMIIGDIKRDSLYNIFHNDIANTYRKILRKNEFEKIPHCNRCFDLMNIQGKNKILDTAASTSHASASVTKKP
jgi:radical SAM protein with 4Fe4S-binding SPASM domain